MVIIDFFFFNFNKSKHVFFYYDLDLLGCRCARGQKVLSHLKKNVRVDELSKWEHHSTKEKWVAADAALGNAADGLVTFVFSKHRDPAKEEISSEINGIDPLAVNFFFKQNLFSLLNDVYFFMFSQEKNEFDESFDEEDDKDDKNAENEQFSQ